MLSWLLLALAATIIVAVALQLGRRSAYDAAYIALAETLGCELLTADRRLAFAPGPRCPVRLLA